MQRRHAARTLSDCASAGVRTPAIVLRKRISDCAGVRSLTRRRSASRECTGPPVIPRAGAPVCIDTVRARYCSFAAKQVYILILIYRIGSHQLDLLSRAPDPYNSLAVVQLPDHTVRLARRNKGPSAGAAAGNPAKPDRGSQSNAVSH